MNKVTVLPCQFGDCVGYDLQINDHDATVYDFLFALDEFAAENIADCRGCDGCCWERAPLTIGDIPRLATLLPPSPYPCHAVVGAFGTLSIEDGVVDIMLSRREDSSCSFLDREGRFCTSHATRTFVCRSHYCMPKSGRLQDLRGAYVNAGIDELVRQLLAEEAAGAEVWLTGKIDPEDYPANPLTGMDKPIMVKIRDIVEPELWEELLEE
ncbi:MAG: YkgJ family cysteine cluster protein [Firmicutes bacterium]|nr:YkgJ family cysteine cluster protein [Bacillota bacterium]